jgi:hypothetical protein
LNQDEITSHLENFSSNLNLLKQSLPPRFAANLDKVYQELPLIFSGALPFVLSHRDLCEMNPLISLETGQISGILDWAEAEILPFGLSLWGYENILGYMNPEGWHYYENHRELEALFWQTFLEKAAKVSEDDLNLIRFSRLAGLFYRYGIVVDGKAVIRVVNELDVAPLRYLDAFCASNEWAQLSFT